MFENRLPKGYNAGGFLPEIASALREAVVRGGPNGYPLSGFRAALIGGEDHTDGSPRGFHAATLLALRDAFRLSETILWEN